MTKKMSSLYFFDCFLSMSDKKKHNFSTACNLNKILENPWNQHNMPPLSYPDSKKNYTARSWVSWVSKDQKCYVEYKYIGFLFNLPLIFVQITKIGLFIDHFCYYWWDFFANYTSLNGKLNRKPMELHLILNFWSLDIHDTHGRASIAFLYRVWWASSLELLPVWQQIVIISDKDICSYRTVTEPFYAL